MLSSPPPSATHTHIGHCWPGHPSYCQRHDQHASQRGSPLELPGDLCWRADQEAKISDPSSGSSAASSVAGEHEFTCTGAPLLLSRQAKRYRSCKRGRLLWPRGGEREENKVSLEVAGGRSQSNNCRCDRSHNQFRAYNCGDIIYLMASILLT